MKHNYISLGGGCDAAMVLTRLGLRNKSLGFDWLWNLDEGLKAVIKILQNKYQDVTTENCYTISDHYRFEKKMITYSSIPSIVHLHSNPMEDLAEHEKLVRRFQRFENILKDDSIKHFIYYRNYEEDKLKNKELKIKDSLLRLIQEGNDFYELVLSIYPDINTKLNLLLILQSLPIDEPIAIAEIKKSTKLQKNKSIKLAYTIARNDDEVEYQNIWFKQWKNNLYTKTNTPWFVVFINELKLILSIFKELCQLMT